MPEAVESEKMLSRNWMQHNNTGSSRREKETKVTPQQAERFEKTRGYRKGGRGKTALARLSSPDHENEGVESWSKTASVDRAMEKSLWKAKRKRKPSTKGTKALGGWNKIVERVCVRRGGEISASEPRKETARTQAERK